MTLMRNGVIRRSQKCARGAFTLVDLIVTVMIIATLAAVATPRFFDSLNDMQARTAARRIQTDLNYAREAAMSESKTLTVSFTPGSGSYSIPGLTHLNHPGQMYAINLSQSPYSASIVSATLGGDADVVFDRFGHPDSGGTITVQSGSFQTTVTINADSGKASIP